MNRLILVGGGHAHLYVIRQLNQKVKNITEVLLVSANEKQYYSGMASGTLEGYYSESDMSIDLGAYCTHHGIKFIKAAVTSVDHDKNQIQLDTNEVLSYDYVSFNTGSEMHFEGQSGGFMIKPLTQITAIITALKKKAANEHASDTLKVVVVGTGAAGIEMGLAAKTRLEETVSKVQMTFVSSGDTMLKGFGKKASEKLMQYLDGHPEIHIHPNDKVVDVLSDQITLASGAVIPFDFAIIASGIKASTLYKASGLKTDARGFMAVNGALQSIDVPNIWGAGDCIAIVSESAVPKNGAYAIKQAKVLQQNLENALAQKPFVVYKPQKKFLAIIALKNGRGLLVYGTFVWLGKCPFILKKWIDTQYMKKLKRGL